jgi:hypothetical protein
VAGLCGGQAPAAQTDTSIDNNRPFRNDAGHGATFSTRGSVDLTGEYFQPQGTNGRSCATCHLPQDAWSITPRTIQRLFDESGGTHPVFNPLDANNPFADLSTIDAREAGYSMMLSRGVFRRGAAPRVEPREWDLIAVDDPHGFANLTRLVHWRRAMPTINFPLGSATVNWDGGNTVGSDQRAGLENQARRNVIGAQQGAPAAAEVIADIVDFETSLFTAQLNVLGVGRLDADGARGGAEAMASMAKVAGRFDLFDAWSGHPNPRRAQIARGQALFNDVNPGGRSCNACHNLSNNGTNLNDVMFDIATASAAARTPDLPLYTLVHRTTGETIQTSDPGRALVTGKWSDVGLFKGPVLRGLAGRAPYFHNGSAATIADAVDFYDERFNINFTAREKADLIAFLLAL